VVWDFGILESIATQLNEATQKLRHAPGPCSRHNDTHSGPILGAATAPSVSQLSVCLVVESWIHVSSYSRKRIVHAKV